MQGKRVIGIKAVGMHDLPKFPRICNLEAPLAHGLFVRQNIERYAKSLLKQFRQNLRKFLGLRDNLDALSREAVAEQQNAETLCYSTAFLLGKAAAHFSLRICGKGNSHNHPSFHLPDTNFRFQANTGFFKNNIGHPV